MFAQFSNNLGVTAATKRLSNLAVSELLTANEFLVDRDAYRYLHRLHEALIYKNERQICHICKLLIKHFDFDPTNDIIDDLEKANKETLAKSDLSVICIYGLDLSSRKNLKKLIALLSRCPKVKKIELVFCTLNHDNVSKLFELMTKLECLCFLGLRGNKLNIKSVHKLHYLLEEAQNFPSLMWVDFRNNNGINTIPGQFVQLLMGRREKHRALPKSEGEKESISVQDAMNGKVV
ncbi:hypothetical protein ACROYT_G006661 [Oculina patagonica]